MSLRIAPQNYTNNTVSFGKKNAEKDPNKKIKNHSSAMTFACLLPLGYARLFLGKFNDKLFNKTNNGYSEQEAKTIRNAVNQTFETSGLKAKGYKIIDVFDTLVDPKAKKVDWLKELNKSVREHPENIEKLYQNVPLIDPRNKRAFAEFIKENEKIKTPLQRLMFKVKTIRYSLRQESSQNLKPGTIVNSPKMRKMIQRYIHSLDFKGYEQGMSASAIPSRRVIILPHNALPSCGAHEFGHALNSTKLLNKVMAKASYLGMLITPIMLLSIFGKNRKETENKKLTPVDKTINFVRNNAGKLVFAAFIPQLVEEALASRTGNKLLKNLLKPETYKKVLKGHGAAFYTYLSTALLFTLNAFAAVKVKNHFQNKYENKVKAQNNVVKAQNQTEQTAAVSDLKPPSQADNRVFSKFPV